MRGTLELKGIVCQCGKGLDLITQGRFNHMKIDHNKMAIYLKCEDSTCNKKYKLDMIIKEETE